MCEWRGITFYKPFSVHILHNYVYFHAMNFNASKKWLAGLKSVMLIIVLKYCEKEQQSLKKQL